MIRKVTIRRFKRFREEVFELPGHVVLAGPNNTGKTTVLQAIATWGLAISRWRELNHYRKHRGGYTRAPIARQAFSAVPLRNFNLLWNERSYTGTVEIEVQLAQGGRIGVELTADSTEQIHLRPTGDSDHDGVRALPEMGGVVYVPPMTGIGTQEPVYTQPKLNQLLGQMKPGEVIRNLIVQAHQSESAWPALQESLRRLFGYELLPPDASGADIIAEYQVQSGPRYDIASAGSGFQQVLMLLAFLHTRPSSVLLIDEPDAHLHVILQDAIYGELRSVAAQKNSQLVIATHSEVIIDSVDPAELCMLLDHPVLLTHRVQRERLSQSLGILTQTDVALATQAPGILYLEGHTDLNNLREWARILQHPVYEFLTRRVFWKPSVLQTRRDAPGVAARDHYEALRLVRQDLPGFMLLDGDDNPNIPDTPITGSGLQRMRWRRYETESYLVHPAALERFVELKVGPGVHSVQSKKDMRGFFENQFGRELAAEFHTDPLNPKPIVESYLQRTKARKDIIPAVLTAAGIHGFDYTRYSEIAAVMLPEEIHPEVKEKLDAIKRAFNL